MTRAKDLFIEQQIESYNADAICIEADAWEEERILKLMKPEPIGRRIFSKKFRNKNRTNKLNLQKLPF